MRQASHHSRASSSVRLPGATGAGARAHSGALGAAGRLFVSWGLITGAG